jgi:uncharacterized Zn finger protein (UPF0148 family)
MPVFEKYCDKCGEPSKMLKNVNGRMLCPKCRGIRLEEDEETGRKAQLRKLWGIKERKKSY